jgi:hypothetical protein
VVLLCGMLFLYRNRQVPSVRIRKLPILFTGVLSLHAFGLIALMSNVLSTAFPCGVVSKLHSQTTYERLLTSNLNE